MTDTNTPEPVKTDVTVKTDDTSNSQTHITDDKVTFSGKDEDTTTVEGQWPPEADEHVRRMIARAVARTKAEIDQAQATREAIEEHRADRRNRNRLLTLFFAIIIGFIVVTFFENDGFAFLGWKDVLTKSADSRLYGYSFIITVALDASLALYAYIKKF